MSTPSRARMRQLRILGHAERLEEGAPPAVARTAIVLIVALIAGLVGWSAVTTVNENAIASGQIVPSGAVHIVQHLEGGIIAEIIAEEGATLEAGRSILRLAEAATLSEHDQLKSREAALLLKVERLRAFAERRPAAFAQVAPGYQSLIADQAQILARQIAARAAQNEVLLRRRAEREAEIRSATAQIVQSRRQAVFLKEELEMRRTLLDRGLVSRIVYLETERQVARLEGETNQAEGALARAREQAGEIEQQMGELSARLANEAFTELGLATGELGQVRDGLRKTADRLARLVVTAPVRGQIKGLRGKSAGGVIAPGGIVAEIVPAEDELMAEVRIEPRDIGNVHIGQAASVKVSAFDFTRFGAIEGSVRNISASTFSDGSGEPYYKALIGLSRPYVSTNAKTNRVVSGMTVRADIKTGERTVLQYLVKPIEASLASAFRER